MAATYQIWLVFFMCFEQLLPFSWLAGLCSDLEEYCGSVFVTALEALCLRSI